MKARRSLGCVVVGIALSLLLLGCIKLIAGCDKLIDKAFDPCGNQVVKTVGSPDGKLKVVVFERDCGATTGSSTQVSLLRSSDRLPNKGGNLFIADDDHGAAPNGPGGGPQVGVAWKANRQLLVKYDPRARVFLSAKRLTVRVDWLVNETVDARYALTRVK
jgi:hypothetical protein